MSGSDRILQQLLKLHPKKIDLNLNRILSLLDKLGNPQHNLPPVIHIAGTNGKGSTLAFIQSIAESARLKVHRYSSPHLVYFHERITLAGETITEKALEELLQECAHVQGDQPITFFEITTAAAFLAFSRISADILLLETGLGGRLDATNVVQEPLMTILSKIGIDHQEFLGQTIEDISREKVAIARPHIPMISTRQHKAAKKVIGDYCTEHHVPLSIAPNDWDYKIETDQRFYWHRNDQKIHFPAPSLMGRHQYENASLAIRAAQELSKYFPVIDKAAIDKGISSTVWPGRMQRISAKKSNLPHGIHLWIDGGHNVDAAKALAPILGQLEQPRLIIGMLGNKDVQGFLDQLTPFLKYGQAVTIPDEPAALCATELAKLSPQINATHSIPQAIENAVQTGGENIILCGSLYLIGGFLRTNL